MSREFISCPSCHNSTTGEKIYQCKECSAIYCSVCFPRYSCKECGVDWTDATGFFYRFRDLGLIK